MYATPTSRNRSSPLGRSKSVPDGPITDFTALIKETQPEAWQKRTAALQKLVDKIPHGIAYAEGGSQWFNSPSSLRHLAWPLSELLKDPRSTVVKRVCENLIELFNKCQLDARYLFKDIMQPILAVHAQTVHIVRQAVQNMVMESIPEVPCKMVMPLWMERLKTDKSRTVREACALYLGRSLMSWTEEGYLTNEIWMQVGSTLMRSLRDPSPHVRSHSKAALEYIQQYHPHHWDALINDPAGPASKDVKLQKWLKVLETRGTANDAADELSIASKFSYNSDSRFATKSNLRISSPRVMKVHQPGESISSGEENYLLGSTAVPVSIDVTHKSAPDLPSGRVPFPQAMSESPVPSNRAPPRLPPQHRPPHINTDAAPDNDYEYGYNSSPNDHDVGKDPSTPINVADGRGDAPETCPDATSPYDMTNDDHVGEGAFILSTDDLKKHASRRRSHSSLLMQERFRKSSTLGSSSNHIIHEEDATEYSDLREQPRETPRQQVDPPSSQSNPASPTSPESPSVPQAPEHMVIAIRLLRAHKSHVDQIMETLKIEMDTLRDFDRLLEEPGRPTEEEVLNYFESVGLCLDQRFLVGRELQREMDRISRGEPPE